MRKVVLSRWAANKLDKLLEYLEANWSTKVKSQFLDKLTTSLTNLSQFPEIGQGSEEVSGLRQFVITKQTTLYYRFNDKQLQVVTLFDTRMNPKKLRKEIK